MKSLTSQLQRVATAFNDINCDVTHYAPVENAETPYIVWAEQGEGESFNADNAKSEQSIEGVVDFYTQTEFDPILDDIQDTLNSLEGCSWKLDTCQYENETGIIHYTWNWELI